MTTFNSTAINEVYAPIDWECGDTITADKLNKVENRLGFVGGGTLPIGVTVTEETDEGDEYQVLTLDKTAEQIINAMRCGKVPVILLDSGDGVRILDAIRLVPIVRFEQSPVELSFYVAVDASDSTLQADHFNAESLTDYPVLWKEKEK